MCTVSVCLPSQKEILSASLATLVIFFPVLLVLLAEWIWSFGFGVLESLEES